LPHSADSREGGFQTFLREPPCIATRGTPLPIRCLSLRIRHRFVVAPLRRVPEHVEEAPRIRLLPADRMQRMPLFPRVPRRCAQVGLCDTVVVLRGGSRPACILPLRLRRKAKRVSLRPRRYAGCKQGSTLLRTGREVTGVIQRSCGARPAQASFLRSCRRRERAPAPARGGALRAARRRPRRERTPEALRQAAGHPVLEGEAGRPAEEAPAAGAVRAPSPDAWPRPRRATPGKCPCR